MKSVCYIVGAGDNSGTNFSINKENDDCVIAADGGFETLKNMEVEPDYIIGDFDSLGYVPKGENVIRHKVKKDDTDMMLAVQFAMKKGYKNIIIYGGCGGSRIDHTFANIQTMLYASRRGVCIKMTDAVNDFYVITNKEIKLASREKGNLSVFALGGMAEGVDIIGAMYATDKITLYPDSTLSVSNSFIGKNVEIKVRKGSLLIVAEK
jgi:thiamine pyrophosphokinase